MRKPRTIPTFYPVDEDNPCFTHKFTVGGSATCYLTIGLYEDGQPAEVRISIAKKWSTVGGVAEAFARAITLLLQHGVPLEMLINEFAGVRFEPYGHTSNKDIPMVKSIVDYVFRYLGQKFLEPKQEALETGEVTGHESELERTKTN